MRFPTCAVAAALLAKLFLALFTTGSNDALTWTHDLFTLRTEGPASLYREGVQCASPSGKLYQMQPFVHPPGVVSGLSVMGWESSRIFPVRRLLFGHGYCAHLRTLARWGWSGRFFAVPRLRV